jgi:hypothetical protein
MIDDFVISPTSRLRRTRLEFGTYYKIVCKSTFCETIMIAIYYTQNVS